MGKDTLKIGIVGSRKYENRKKIKEFISAKYFFSQINTENKTESKKTVLLVFLATKFLTSV